MRYKSQLAGVLSFLILFFLLSCSNTTSQSSTADKEVSVKNHQASPTPVTTSRNTSECGFEENDDSAPTSMKSLKDDFKNADIVVFAEVLSSEPDSLEKGYRPYTLKAKVKESFKGPFVEGESIIYSEVREVYDDEPHESHSLGDRILWLRKWNDKGNDRYGNIEFMWGGIDCDILEKLRKISKGK